MTVRKRGKSWQYDFRHEGERYRQGGYKTKRDAVHAENERLNNLGRGVDLVNEVIFTEYFRYWMKTTKGHVSERTYKNYQNTADWLTAYFRDKKIRNITRADYQSFLNWYGTEAESRNGWGTVGHSKEASRKLNGHVKSCVKDALFEGIISKDFTYRTQTTHAVDAKPKDLKYLSLEEAKALKSRVLMDKSITALAIFISLVTGARFSDLVQMKYTDINADENELFLPGTKNDTAPRHVRIAEKDMQHIIRCLDDRPRNLNGYVFQLHFGLITNNAVNKAMRKFCSELEIKRVTFHALRHTHASILIYQDISLLYISKRLGHSSPETTLRVYAHVIAEKQQMEEEKTVDVFEAL
ncbi:tyrosine-type recombinase/integrase [Salinicoccus roseus]|uniref:Site-specific recombinase XerD n=1 Tax=Salinicoccus roseus TaxID=45670 RepID=A0A265E6D0_9STAP|nr:site-specific integrase [Salinicoccus roseus]OZT77151.1 hypothetical protein CFN03_08735 [Salinicoccus roseus]